MLTDIGRSDTQSELATAERNRLARTLTHTLSEAPGTTFDWFLTAEFLIPFFEELTAEAGKDARILMLGCGNSRLSEVMYDAGWHNIVNLDVSGGQGEKDGDKLGSWRRVLTSSTLRL